jgi:hypothetical protein
MLSTRLIIKIRNCSMQRWLTLLIEASIYMMFGIFGRKIRRKQKEGSLSGLKCWIPKEPARNFLKEVQTSLGSALPLKKQLPGMNSMATKIYDADSGVFLCFS